MDALKPYFANNAVQSLKPAVASDSVWEHIQKLLGLLGDDGLVEVDRIHKELFPLSTKASANTQLNRLIKKINETAENQGSSLRACVTADKKAKPRHVWFEGASEVPSAILDELEAIPEGGLETDVRGMPGCPVVVLITFNRLETEGVLKVFLKGKQVTTSTVDGITYNRLGKHGGMEVVHRISEQGQNKAQQAAAKAIAAWGPKAVIAVGVAFGMNRAKQKLGDVLVSRSVRDYELERRGTGATIPRGDRVPASPILINRFETLDHNKRCAVDSATWPIIHMGVLVSGNKLVDDPEFVGSLIELEPEAVGGDMEAVGILTAAYPEHVDWIVVKGICDWADGNKGTGSKEQDQKKAGSNAARVVKTALDMGGLYDGSGPPKGEKTPSGPCPLPPPQAMSLKEFSDIPEKIRERDTYGAPATMKKREKTLGASAPAVEPDSSTRGVPVLPHLMDWVKTPDAPPLFALLGEYGMGKTVCCQSLAWKLGKLRETVPGSPAPMYFDLRLLTGLADRVPLAEEALMECVRRGWKDQGDLSRLQWPDMLKTMARGAVLIVDGLDEALVKLTKADGQTFTNNLLKLLSDIRNVKADKPSGPVKMLLSCRTHYFPTLRAQQTHFTGQERGKHGPEAYQSLVLLPWNEDQVLHYLKAVLPGWDSQRILDTLKSVHDLSELTPRPYSLKLVSEFIPEIEQERMRGTRILGIDLYRHVTDSWLDRDDGKHQIAQEHKPRLAAHLAAHLWRAGQGLLKAENIHEWFHAWLEEQPAGIRARYKDMHPDRLEEDLRTATFLVRLDDQGKSSFRFAHTSMQEYFLARYLAEALDAERLDDWTMPMPSRETFGFLEEMRQRSKEEDADALARMDESLKHMLEEAKPQRTEAAVAFWTRLYDHGAKPPAPEIWDLRNADLKEWNLNTDSTSAADTVSLQGARLAGANLHGCDWRYVNARGADFSGADLYESVWEHVDARDAAWDGTGLAFAKWRGVEGVPLGGETRPLVLDGEVSIPPSETTSLCVQTGHSGIVNDCAFSPAPLLGRPAGGLALSAASDNTLRLWDMADGQCLDVWKGHESEVNACSFSPAPLLGRPAGGLALSAAHDNTLRLWDVVNGQCLGTWKGHERVVNACAFSPAPLLGRPAGGLALSAAWDKTLRLWDVAKGQCLAVWKGHERGVNACAFSPAPLLSRPAGGLALSAANDNTLRLWDVAKGQCLAVWKGHEHGVNACAFSPAPLLGHPAGGLALSAADDNTQRLWDVANGKCIAVWRGHNLFNTTCVFSPAPLLGRPTGGLALSAGWDNTPRLWDVTNGNCITVREEREALINACAFSPAPLLGRPTGGLALSAAYDSNLQLWDVEKGQCLTVWKGHELGVTACAFCPAPLLGRPAGGLALSAAADNTLRLWDVASGQCLAIWKEHDATVNACAFSPAPLLGRPAGGLALSAAHDNTLRLWDVASGQCLAVWKGHEDVVNTCAFSPAPLLGRAAGGLALSAAHDNTLRLWDVANGQCLAVWKGHGASVNACAFSPVPLFDRAAGGLALSAAIDKTLRLWDVASGQCMNVWKGHERSVNACAFSPAALLGRPAGGLALSAADDNTLRLWDVANGQCLAVWKGHESGVKECTFSSSALLGYQPGTLAISTSHDGTIRFWDVAKGVEIRRIQTLPDVHEEPQYAVIDPQAQRYLKATSQAWRFLRYKEKRGQGSDMEILLHSAEAFGPIPEPES